MSNLHKPAFVLAIPSGLHQYTEWCRRKAQYLAEVAPAEDLKTASSFWDFITQDEVPQCQVSKGVYDEEDADFVLVGSLREAERIFMRVATEVLQKK